MIHAHLQPQPAYSLPPLDHLTRTYLYRPSKTRSLVGRAANPQSHSAGGGLSGMDDYADGDLAGSAGTLLLVAEPTAARSVYGSIFGNSSDTEEPLSPRRVTYWRQPYVPYMHLARGWWARSREKGWVRGE